MRENSSSSFSGSGWANSTNSNPSVPAGLSAVMHELAPGKYQSRHRHGGEAWLLGVSGEGYSVVDDVRHDWAAGDLVVVDHWQWHQHFNVGDEPGRYLPISYGGFRYPFTKANVANVLHRYSERSAIQIEYEDEDPRIRETFDEARATWQRTRATEESSSQ